MDWIDQDQDKPDSDTTLADTKDEVTQGFLWISQQVVARLDDLEADLRAEDKPSLVEALLHGAVRAALAGATSGASELVAGALVKAAEPLRELVKSTIENGVSEAISTGKQAMNGAREPLHAFIAGQKAAVREGYRLAQKKWLKLGRHQVKSQQQADELAAAMSGERASIAANLYYTAGRDQWLAYLAQAQHGARQSKALDENYDIVEIGPTTDFSRKDSDLFEAGMGRSDGVLTVLARLPDIHSIGGSGLHGMSGKVQIEAAFMNGVNAIIRDQFVGQPLTSMRIPRIVVCNVDSGESFTIRVNEKGHVFGGGKDWLRARATAGHPGNIGKQPDTLEEIGLDLLLADLVPTKVYGGATP